MGVVLSYSRQDSDFADILNRLLESKGYDVWIDRRNIEVGSRWDQSIEVAINTRSHLAVILSPASAASENVADEWSYAFEKGKTIIPIYYQACDVPMRLRRLQRIDFEANAIVTAFDQLMSALGAPDRRPADRIELARREGLIYISLPSADLRIAFLYSDYPHLDAFIRTVWFCLLWSVIPRNTTQDRFYEYGKKWIFTDKVTGAIYKLPEGNNTLLVHDIGIEPNSEIAINLL